ncbi:MAG: hypothetical protein HOI35_01540 [Woeseia sp.]|jgi:hypothetical protein|nr:hypothetical protein [Woeseia sp.]MBT6208690.1 hypothetical protein [Woeseia sp.]
MRAFSAILIATSILWGCSTPEFLPSRDGAVPIGVDLSGNWQLRTNSSSDQVRVRDAIRQTDGVKDDDVFTQPDRQSGSRTGRANRRKLKGGLVHVFLELGESLKVTQTDNGIFISFDRSIVEELRFGENRLISVGEAEAQRVTGWEGDAMVVDTLDRNGMKMTETFRLLEGGRVMERKILFRSKKDEEATIVRVFDRVD